MKTVLVIEDDTALCTLLEQILRKKYRIIMVNNGLDAWIWLTNGNIPDLILSDIKMPEVDGIEFLENLSLSGLFRNIPVMVLSGTDDEEMRQKCFDKGVVLYMVKPFDPQKLLDEIQQLFVSKMFL